MNNRTVIRHGQIGLYVIQRFEPQNILGKNAVRITHQKFYGTGRQFPRASTHRRTGSRSVYFFKPLGFVKISCRQTVDDIAEIINRKVQCF